ncbi:septal ring lytic transglycosylase RlpA family protein [Tessaracoccus antarcticus]|nr:septal ring lytic transglycosylase RlpA family protein [Tessaracoccus antarcticus]
MARTLLIPAVAGISALALVTTAGLATALHKNDVELVVDNSATSIAVREDTVAAVLELEGIELGEHDIVLPGPETRISQGMEITVAYGRPLDLSVDGVKRTVWTTAPDVGQALAFLNLDAQDSKLSTSRSTGISRQGLSVDIATAKDVTLTVAGKTTQLTVAGTVADALAEAGVTPDADDTLTPAADTTLTDGLAITFVDVEVKTSAKEVDIPFKKTTTSSETMAKGEKKITTKGAVGMSRETYTDVYHDGRLVSSTLAKSVISRQPVHEVTTLGTKEPAPKVEVADPGVKKTAPTGSNNLTPASGSTCMASYYWEAQPTANGEQFNTNAMTAAHKSLPFNTMVKVTNLANGKSAVVRINDRGPYISGRCLDLSTAAMQQIGGTSSGVVKVAYEVVG